MLIVASSACWRRVETRRYNIGRAYGSLRNLWGRKTFKWHLKSKSHRLDACCRAGF